MNKKITANNIEEYQIKRTIGEFKKLARELRDRVKLTDKEAIDHLLNNKNIVEILAKKRINNE